MKKMLVISSTPVVDDNSDRLCGEIMRGASDAGHAVSKVALRDLRLHFCSGCGLCEEHGVDCRIKDDAVDVMDDMLKSDVIVFATNNCYSALSAQLKTLLERCRSIEKRLVDKRFIFVVAGEKPGRVNLYDTAISMTGFVSALKGSKILGAVYAPGNDVLDSKKGEKILERAYLLGSHLDS